MDAAAHVRWRWWHFTDGESDAAPLQVPLTLHAGNGNKLSAVNLEGCKSIYRPATLQVRRAVPSDIGSWEAGLLELLQGEAIVWSAL